MNAALSTAIIQHILSQLGVMSSSYVDMKKTKSILDKEFVLPEKLSFQEEEVIKRDIWGCQLSSGQHEVKILIGDCSQDGIQEYCAVIQLKDTPAYGLYLVGDPGTLPLIAVAISEVGWMSCTTFLQATFLAGMEQVKETCLTWSKCSDYKSLYGLMLSLIKYHDQVYGE